MGLPEGWGGTEEGGEGRKAPGIVAARGAEAGEAGGESEELGAGKAPRRSRESGSGRLGPSTVRRGSHRQLGASSSSSVDAGWLQPGARWRPLCARTQPRGWLQYYLQIKTTKAITRWT